MKLLTKDIETKLRRNAEATRAAQERELAEPDHVPVLKVFAPWSNATWLFTELAEDGDTLFGLCDLGMGFPELGYASLSEIQEARGPAGLPLERDVHFATDRPLSDFAQEARRRERIVA